MVWSGLAWCGTVGLGMARLAQVCPGTAGLHIDGWTSHTKEIGSMMTIEQTNLVWFQIVCLLGAIGFMVATAVRSRR